MKTLQRQQYILTDNCTIIENNIKDEDRND